MSKRINVTQNPLKMTTKNPLPLNEAGKVSVMVKPQEVHKLRALQAFAQQASEQSVYEVWTYREIVVPLSPLSEIDDTLGIKEKILLYEYKGDLLDRESLADLEVVYLKGLPVFQCLWVPRYTGYCFISKALAEAHLVRHSGDYKEPFLVEKTETFICKVLNTLSKIDL